MTRGEGHRHGEYLKGTLAAAGVATVMALGTGVAGAGETSGGGGGITAPETPVVKDVHCVQRCLDVRKVTETGRAEITGRNLDAVETVRLGSGKHKVKVEPKAVSSRSVVFVVPKKAGNGKPTVIDEFGNAARSPARLVIKPESAIKNVKDFKVKRAKVVANKTFFNGKKPSQIEYLFEARSNTDILVNVLKGKSGKIVDSFVEERREPFANNVATWDGLAENGKVAPNGKYKLEVSQLSGEGSAADRFRFYGHTFPLRAKHSYGDGLGAGRNHQGVDIFARCGSPIVAARGGKVQVRDYQGAAGYYIVIDGTKTGVDHAYLHLLKRGRVKKGARVKTGDVIGYTGQTGRASGCHLHLEVWSAPGYYEGGKVLDAKKIAKRWDRWS